MADVGELTDAEKVALTAGADYSLTHALPARGVPAIALCDGPHGVRKQPSTKQFSTAALPATCFPTASALAASWDLDLIHEVGIALGEEARAAGVSVLLGPGCNIKRTPLCGRNFEYFAEDPFLSSRLAAAWIGGVQSTGVGASLKHFAANNIEARRYIVDSLVDERALREIYLASFEYAIMVARPATIMAAYNRLNGRYCTDSPWLLTTLLREEWGFDGLVVSDWGATNGRASSMASGLDLSMPGTTGGSDASVLAALKDGSLPAAALGRASGAVLRLIAATTSARTVGTADRIEEHHQLARRAAAAGTVLLRNVDEALPMAPGASVALLGDFAKRPRYQGAGSSGIHPHRLDNLHDSLVAAGVRVQSTVDGADVAVVVVGLPEADEVEGLDRTHLRLPAAHDALVEAAAAAHSRVVVVVQAGAPVVMPWRDKVSAIVYAYLGGQAGGSALADVLCGRSEPGGRLAESFPLALEDNPVHGQPFGPRQTEYWESLYVGYRWYDSAGVEVAYAFGHGLSYTTFAWSDASVQRLGAASASVSVTIANTGTRAGSEVVQVYVHDDESSVFRPLQELKGFVKVHLGPGESRRVTVTLDDRSFAFWDVARHRWSVEAGSFTIRLGASSRDIRSELAFEAHGEAMGDAAPEPLSYKNIMPSRKAQGLGWPSPFSREAFAQLYGQPLPDNVVDKRGEYTINTPIADMQHWSARALLRFLHWATRLAVRGDPAAPGMLLVHSTIDEATPRMLPMFLGNRWGSWLGRRLVRAANRG